MKIQLIAVGRAKVTKEVEVKDLEGALSEVCKHLASSDVSLHKRSDDPNSYNVSAGFHTVGMVRVLSV